MPPQGWLTPVVGYALGLACTLAQVAYSLHIGPQPKGENPPPSLALWLANRQMLLFVRYNLLLGCSQRLLEEDRTRCNVLRVDGCSLLLQLLLGTRCHCAMQA